MNKYQEIDQLLKEIASFATQYPNYSFNTEETRKIIYNHIKFRYVKKEDRSMDLSKSPNPFFKSAFDNWIQKNKRKNTHVYVDPNWSYFCQFLAKDGGKTYHSKEHLKVYIPLDGKHIEKGANMIFDFLDQNQISHLSKIGKQIRFDDIVVRLIEPKDLQKLMDFIQSNSYIQSGLIHPNPFAFQQNNISLACDGNISYNNTVASLIDLYIAKKKQNRELDQVGYQDFFQTISHWYKEQFMNHNTTPLEYKFNFKHKKAEEENYEKVIQLILKVQDSNFNMRNYIRHYEESKYQKEYGKEKRFDDIEKTEIIDMIEESKQDLDHTLMEAVQIMKEKFGVETGLKGIEAYYYEGNPNYITRLNNLRDTLENSHFRENMKKRLESVPTTFRNYTLSKMAEHGMDMGNMI